jgi:hypothetical protein
VTNCFGTVTSATAQLSNGGGGTFELKLNGAGPSAAGNGSYGIAARTGKIGITTVRFAQGARFHHWSGPAQVSFGDSSAPQTYAVVTNPTAGATMAITAHYQNVPELALSVVNGSGSGVTRATTFQSGEMVQVAAAPAPAGMSFAKWVGGPIDGSTDPSPTFTMPAADLRVVATYATGGSGGTPANECNGGANGAGGSGQAGSIDAGAGGASAISSATSAGSQGSDPAEPLAGSDCACRAAPSRKASTTALALVVVGAVLQRRRHSTTDRDSVMPRG